MNESSVFKLFKERLRNRLVHNHFPIKIKIFKLSCFTSLIACSVGIFVNSLTKFPLILNIMLLACFCVSLWLYFKKTDEKYLEFESLTLILILLFTIGLSWFINGGLHSSSPYFILLLISISALLLSKKNLYFTFFLSALMLMGLSLFRDTVSTLVESLR